MKRDSNGRFTSKKLIIPLPSASFFIDEVLFIFLFVPWIYACSRLNILPKIFNILSDIFSNCECPNPNDKY